MKTSQSALKTCVVLENLAGPEVKICIIRAKGRPESKHPRNIARSFPAIVAEVWRKCPRCSDCTLAEPRSQGLEVLAKTPVAEESLSWSEGSLSPPAATEMFVTRKHGLQSLQLDRISHAQGVPTVGPTTEPRTVWHWTDGNRSLCVYGMWQATIYRPKKDRFKVTISGANAFLAIRRNRNKKYRERNFTQTRQTIVCPGHCTTVLPKTYAKGLDFHPYK